MLGITFGFPHSFYSGVGSSVEVPSKWDIALNGRGYMLDTDHPAFGGESAYLGRMGIETIPLIRQQADGSTEPGESTINPEDLWPRAQSSWHLGAGQQYLDQKNSDRHRFRSSKGLDPWTLGQLKLLNSTTHLVTSSNTNLAVLRVGDYLYYADGTTVNFAQAPFSSFANSVMQNGESAQTVASLCSDGHTVYAALGTNGIHTTVKAASTSAHYSDLQATLVAYVKGRLMAAKGASVYNVVASGAAPTALFTQANSDFSWVAFAEGLGNIYMAGYSGDKSLIYGTSIKTDGTALDAPVVRGQLPDGEIVHSLTGYLGFVVIGTDKGFRLATEDGAGNLTIGALVNTGTACRAFESQDRFVWFGLENYDDTSSGLGRIDLSQLTAPLVPAYASDLMATTQGVISSIATAPGDVRAFAVSGHGIYLESATPVSSGTFTTGLISFGIPDKKIALRLLLKHKPLPINGSVSIDISADDSTPVLVGTSSVAGTTTTDRPIKVQEVAAQLFELTFTLTGSGTILEQYDFRAYPVSFRGKEVLLPILLHELVLTATGKEERIDVAYERQLIEGYTSSDRLVSLQELDATFSVLIEDTNFQRRSATTNRRQWNGTMLIKAKILGD